MALYNKNIIINKIYNSHMIILCTILFDDNVVWFKKELY